ELKIECVGFGGPQRRAGTQPHRRNLRRLDRSCVIRLHTFAAAVCVDEGEPGVAVADPAQLDLTAGTGDCGHSLEPHADRLTTSREETCADHHADEATPQRVEVRLSHCAPPLAALVPASLTPDCNRYSRRAGPPSMVPDSIRVPSSLRPLPPEAMNASGISSDFSRRTKPSSGENETGTIC